MAQVPNYYYNSPAMENIGRNLASALAPPDPDKLLARQANVWQLQNAQTEAGYKARDRERDKFASEKLGELAAIFENPVLGADGQPDPVASRAKAAGIMKEIYEVGGPQYVNEAEAVAGPLGAGFEAKQRLKTQSENAMFRALGIKNAFTASENDETRAFTTGRDATLHQQRLEYLNIQGAQRIAQINAAAEAKRAKGEDAITLTPAIGNAIMTGIYQRINSTGLDLDDGAIYKLFDEVADDTSRNTKNYATSLERIWNARFPGGVYRRQRAWYELGSGDDEYLSPNFNNPLPAFGAPPTAAAPAADETRDLASPITTPLNAFAARGAAETEMENTSRAASAAETAALPTSTPSPRPARAARGAPTGASKDSPIPVKTPADAAKLPAGTWVITPDGRIAPTKGRRQ